MQKNGENGQNSTLEQSNINLNNINNKEETIPSKEDSLVLTKD